MCLFVIVVIEKHELSMMRPVEVHSTDDLKVNQALIIYCIVVVVVGKSFNF